MATTTTLRLRQTAVARQAIFEALLRHLEAGDADDVAMEDLARDAGVSRRTIYRYFPTRAELIAAASQWIRSDVLQLPIEIGDEGIAGSFRQAAARLEARPQLARSGGDSGARASRRSAARCVARSRASPGERWTSPRPF